MKKLIIYSILAVCTVALSCGNYNSGNQQNDKVDNSKLSYQTFKDAGFRVKCPAALSVNKKFLDMAHQNGDVNMAFSYVGATNKNDAEKACIYHISISDWTKDSEYKALSHAEQQQLDKEDLDGYAEDLAKGGVAHDFTTFCGARAVEYTTKQDGVPMVAIFFYKNGKAYQLQVSSRHNLLNKYESLVQSFELL